LAQELLDLPLEKAIVFDAPLAFVGDRLADSFGRALAGDEAGPAIIDSVEFGWFLLAGAVGFATGAGGGGDASGQQWDRNLENNTQRSEQTATRKIAFS